jgi:hypothetical protein
MFSRSYVLDGGASHLMSRDESGEQCIVLARVALALDESRRHQDSEEKILHSKTHTIPVDSRMFLSSSNFLTITCVRLDNIAAPSLRSPSDEMVRDPRKRKTSDKAKRKRENSGQREKREPETDQGGGGARHTSSEPFHRQEDIEVSREDMAQTARFATATA